MKTYKRRRNNKQVKRRMMCTTILSLIFIFSVILFSNTTTKAVATEDASNRVITITIAEGDNLWKIAKKYGGNENPQEFILDLQEMNQLNSPIIYPGQSLIIPVS